MVTEVFNGSEKAVPQNLGKLSELAGIYLSCVDIGGTEHIASAETLRSLLFSLGIPAGNDEEVNASLKYLEEKPWRKPLSSVIVADEANLPPSREVTFEICQPADKAGSVIPLLIQNENG